MDRSTRGLMDFLDKHEGREKNASFNAINKERVRQGYKKNPDVKKHEVAKKMGYRQNAREKRLNLPKPEYYLHPVKGSKFGEVKDHK